MIVASMFDESGNMVRPWAAAGHTCFCFDILNGYEIEEFAGGGSINYIPVDLSKRSGIRRVIETGADFVFGFPPCTDLAISGARHFAAKEARDPQVFDKAMALVMSVAEVGEALGGVMVPGEPDFKDYLDLAQTRLPVSSLGVWWLSTGR